MLFQLRHAGFKKPRVKSFLYEGTFNTRLLLFFTGFQLHKPMATLLKFGGDAAVKEEGHVVQCSGWLVQFDKVDVDKQFFTKETDFGTDSAVVHLPLMFRHGKSRYAKKRRYGTMLVTRKENGWWAEASMDTTKPYAAQIVKLLKEGRLGWSSGSSEHCADWQKTENGTDEITQWFFAEGSLTPKPAEPSNKATFKCIKSVDDLTDETEVLIPEGDDTTKESPETDLQSEETEPANGATKAAASDNPALKMYVWDMQDAFYKFASLFQFPPSWINLSTVASRLRDLAKFIEAGDFSIFDYSSDNWNEDAYKKFKAIFKEADDMFALAATKAGRRNNKNDQAALDSAHDAIVKAGANCKRMNGKEPAENQDSTEQANEDLTARNAELERLQAENETLKEQLASEAALRQDAEEQLNQLSILKQ